MKKTICLLLTIIIIICFTSCKGNTNFEQSEINAIKKVVMSLDDYLDYKITKEETKAVVKEVQDRLKASENILDNKTSKTTDEIIRSVDLSSVQLQLCSLSLVLSNITSTDSEVLSIRNKLAETIGERSR